MVASLRFAQLQQALLRGQIDPVYLFEGPETFFHEEGIRLLERAALPVDAGGINRHVVDGREADLQELLDLASTYPMGAGRRLILVRRASGLKAESVESLKAYLARPSASTCLIFSDAEFDARRAVYKALAAAATRVDCGALRDVSQVAAWVRDRLKGRSFGLSPELAEAIAVGLSGAGLARVDSEMEKLMAAIGAPRPVEVTDLGILADVPRVGSAFQVALLALRGDRGPALRSVRDLLESGEEPPMMLGAIAWYLRAALKARAAADRRVPPRDLQALYGLNPGRVEQLRSETGKVSAPQLRRALRLCLRADREIKGAGAKNPAHAFERLVHGIARAAGGAS